MLQLKSLTLKSPVIQSPMAGCTDLAFRLLSRKHGMEFSFLEMVSAHALMLESKNTYHLMKSIEADSPLGAQLVGCDPDIMGAAAEKVEEMGFDLLDLNLGCPVRKITATGSGAALLTDPKKTADIFTKVVKSVKKIPVTVKVRKGFNDDSGEEAVQIAKVAEDCGLSLITVHGRTRAQGYSGTADWDAIRKVKEAVNIPVLGNGDVLNGRDARRLIDQTGCDGVMIGRGGLGNPWVYKDIEAEINERKILPAPTRAEKRAAVLEHMRLEAEYEGEERAVFHMRRIGAWYIQGVHNAAFWRAELNRCRTLNDIEAALVKALADEELQETGQPPI